MFLFFTFQLFSQCDFSLSGKGDFEEVNALSDWNYLTNNQGTISLQQIEKYQNEAALKVNVSSPSPWQVRLFNKKNCQFSIKKDSHYAISVYLKGEVGNVFGLSLLNNGATIETKDIQVSSKDWTLYKYSFESTVTTTGGGIRIHFESIGEYYLDVLGLNAIDCFGDIGGGAGFDDCGVCSGGNTSIQPNKCEVNIITPDNNDFVYEGVLESDITSDRAVL